MNLPPLPAHKHSRNSGAFDPLYTAEQMQAYARAALAAHPGAVDRMRDALESIKAHCLPLPSVLAKAIVATCDSALAAAPTEAKPAQDAVDADWLSNVIRSVDGNNTMGAGALAEKIVAAISAKKGG